MPHQNRRNPRHSKEIAALLAPNLGMQIGENAKLTADARRKHLFSLLHAHNADERGLPGCVITEYKRCGKARCRCAAGRLHGPFYYWYGRDFLGPWKIYLKRAAAPRVRALCQQRRDRRVTRESFRASLRFLKARWRELDAYIDAAGDR